MRYRLELDYIGTAYSGWQIQPERRTVQGEIETALSRLTGETVSVTGSGRTDAGVHALKQTAHFDLDREWECVRLTGGLNHFLPSDVRVLGVERASDDFHARYDCTEKSYVYCMYRAPERAFFADRAWAVDENVDVFLMNETAKLFGGEKDFSAFMAAGSDVKTTVRTVTRASVEERGGLILFDVAANGFLYNMVRIMTAVLEAVGRKRLGREEVELIIKSRDRSRVKGIAPACGLYLKSQTYKER